MIVVAPCEAERNVGLQLWRLQSRLVTPLLRDLTFFNDLYQLKSSFGQKPDHAEIRVRKFRKHCAKEGSILTCKLSDVEIPFDEILLLHPASMQITHVASKYICL